MTEDQEYDQNRAPGPTIDLERLEEHARDLYLHRFVAHIRKARGEHGRYLQLRPGDELAIKAADDESARLLENIVVEDIVVEPATDPEL